MKNLNRLACLLFVIVTLFSVPASWADGGAPMPLCPPTQSSCNGGR